MTLCKVHTPLLEPAASVCSSTVGKQCKCLKKIPSSFSFQILTQYLVLFLHARIKSMQSSDVRKLLAETHLILLEKLLHAKYQNKKPTAFVLIQVVAETHKGNVRTQFYCCCLTMVAGVIAVLLCNCRANEFI